MVDNNQTPPWAYAVEDPACARPSGARLIDVEDIRFTQSHVNDSFSHEMRPVMEMVNSLLSGALKQRDIPIIRGAWRDGAFWSIDNRRTFVTKHCKVGRAVVEACDWELHRAFDMKWKGGNETRDLAGGKQRAGLTQRLKVHPAESFLVFAICWNPQWLRVKINRARVATSMIYSEPLSIEVAVTSNSWRST